MNKLVCLIIILAMQSCKQKEAPKLVANSDFDDLHLKHYGELYISNPYQIGDTLYSKNDDKAFLKVLSNSKTYDDNYHTFMQLEVENISNENIIALETYWQEVYDEQASIIERTKKNKIKLAPGDKKKINQKSVKKIDDKGLIINNVIIGNGKLIELTR